MGQLTNHALDLIATDLSAFSAPEIPDLQLPDDRTLQNNMLESILGVFSGRDNAEVRHVMTDMVRRIFGSIETYRLGKQEALSYIQDNRRKRISPYFRALTHFETCIGYTCQVADILYRQTDEKIFEHGDGSSWQRLHSIHAYGTKHAYDYKSERQDREMPTAVWLTNSGVSCIANATITYNELADMIGANNELFYDVQRRVRNRMSKAQGR